MCLLSQDQLSQKHPLKPFLSGTLTDAGLRNTVGNMSDSRARGSNFNTRSSHILSFRLLLIQEGQSSVTGESMCKKYWLTA